MATKKGVPALKLAFDGAPANWHTVGPVTTEDGHEVGLSGHFHPDKPTPLGSPVTPSLEDAKTYISEHRKMVKRAAENWETFRAERIDADLGDIGEFSEPPCPVELTDVPQKEADELVAELLGLHSESLKAAYLAERAGDGALPHVESQAAAVAVGDNQEG